MTNLLKNPYVQDILFQPQALRATLDSLEKTASVGDIPSQLAAGKLRRVVLTGMGSSLHALYPLMLTLIGRGVSAQFIETAELIHYAPRLLDPQTLLVVVSQSGQSAEILRLLELNAGISPVIAVSNSPDSPLAETADALILTRAGAEHSVSCKTYITALAVLAWLGDELTGRSAQETLNALRKTPAWVEMYLSDWQTHLETLTGILAPIQRLTLIGRGPSLAAVGTGGLIIKEAARFPGEGMSGAAFRHGPLEMVGASHFVLVYTGLPRTAALNRRLAEDIRRIGGRAALVEQSAPRKVFTLPPVPEAALPLLEILPAQMLSLTLAQLRGHDAGSFTHAQKVTSRE
ncbi:MAG: SIS domain-containing protein [Chloroflexota bacterium]|nr:SIS domain-containing protein [Chloroflexota bacterium]